MKDQLEDLAFAELYPDARASIMARGDFLRDKGAGVVPRILAELHRKLEEGGLTGAVVSVARRCPIRSGARCSARMSSSQNSEARSDRAGSTDILALHLAPDRIGHLLATGNDGPR